VSNYPQPDMPPTPEEPDTPAKMSGHYLSKQRYEVAAPTSAKLLVKACSYELAYTRQKEPYMRTHYYSLTFLGTWRVDQVEALLDRLGPGDPITWDGYPDTDSYNDVVKKNVVFLNPSIEVGPSLSAMRMSSPAFADL
jgi:hypothetical protein